MPAVVAWGWDGGVPLDGKSSILTPCLPNGLTQAVRPDLVLIGMWHTPEKEEGDWDDYYIVP